MKNIKIPYGLSDYREIRTEDYIYVDKTRYIEELETLDTKYPVLLRPRRFGKSLFVSTLFYYYDRNSVDDFDLLFGETYIGANKTGKANSYYVLRLEFSGLETDSEEQLREDFYSKVESSLREFTVYYNLDIPIPVNDSYNAARLLNYFLTDCKKKIGKHLYIMIDEYDHFANNIIGNQEFFGSITGRGGFVRSFYEVFKSHSGNGSIDRIFITGVTSMTLDSLTSGFNIAANISMYGGLNEMIGFTDREVRMLLEDTDIGQRDELMSLLAEHYNGYLFSVEKTEATVYNSNLVLYFLKHYKRLGEVPNVLIDSNIRSDYQKLARMFELFPDKDSRTDILEEIMAGKSIPANIITEFTFAAEFTRNEFLSMLFYLGLLTVSESSGAYDVGLKVPNAVIRDVYYNYYMKFLQIDENKKLDAINKIAMQDDFSAYNQLISQALQLHSNDDFMRFGEARLKSIFLSCLSDQKAYLVKSEYETSGRRPDIVLLDIRGGKTNVKYNYLIELKYLKKSEASEKDIAEKRQEAYEQMQNYLGLDEFKQDGRIKGLIYVVVKDKIVCFEEVG